ncbi:MAG: RtcB family protein [Myxococcales bacterium]|nr:RtcB family protein [Myxococcales bacterium]
MAELTTWLVEPLAPDVARAVDRMARAPGVRAIAVMPDVHLAGDVCVGTVVATEGRIYPAAVGGDIGCGVATQAFDVEAARLGRAEAAAALRALRILAPVQLRRDPLPWPEDLDPPPAPVARRLAQRQLGTVGRGNHFVELQADDEGTLWAAVHSGSRGAGKAIRDAHVGDRGAFDPLLDASPEGRAYLADLAWARAYARENRRALLDAVAVVLEGLMGASPIGAPTDCDHNHVEPSARGWLHRKGAISARAGEPGIIPGSMATLTYHVEGRGHAEALWSSSHGAGRRCSRTEARRRFDAGRLRAQMGGVFFDDARAGRLVEEAPAAYRDIEAVMRAQRALTRVVRRLRPILSYKGA